MARHIINEFEQREYYTRRLEQTRLLAISATNPAVRAIHAEMAARYEVLVRNASRRTLPIASTPAKRHARLLVV